MARLRVFIQNWYTSQPKVGSCTIVLNKDYRRRNYISLETYRSLEVNGCFSHIAGGYTKDIGTACFFLWFILEPHKIQEMERLVVEKLCLR